MEVDKNKLPATVLFWVIMTNKPTEGLKMSGIRLRVSVSLAPRPPMESYRGKNFWRSIIRIHTLLEGRSGRGRTNVGK